MKRSDDYYYGMFDGEGCVVNYKRKDTGGPRALRLEINVTNTHLGVLQEFQERYGGRIKLHRNESINRNWKRCYRWILDGHQAAKWLLKSLGHIIIKEKVAVKALNDFLLYRTKLAYFPNEYYEHCRKVGHDYQLNQMGIPERQKEHKYRDVWFRSFYGFEPL